MRIALVSQEYPPHTAHGGIATQTHAKAHGLAALGHEVYVISHSVDNERHEYHDGLVRVARIPGFDACLPLHTQPARWLTYSALVAAELTALHSRVSLDIVDFPDWASEGYVYLLNRTSWNRVPTVIHLHGPVVMLANTIAWPEKDSELFRVATAMEGTCLRLADAVVSSSRCSAAWCAKHYGVDDSVLPVLHSGIDVKLFAPTPARDDAKLTVLFVGRVAASKGIYTLVEAVGRLMGEFPALKLRVVGRAEGQAHADLRKYAEAHGAAQAVEIVGALARDKLPAELSRAHVFAAPSRYEGGPGFVYLEAMACGLPVIACSGSGVTEVVHEGRTGLLVPPDDPAALASALRKLLTDKSLREEMGRQARQFVLAEADSRRCATQFAAFYNSVIGRAA